MTRVNVRGKSGDAKSWSGDGWTLHLGDCLDGLRALADNSVDSIVTDPPAGIGFMGKEWDGDKGGRDQWIAWLEARMIECLRVLKPGGHALVWALPRTSHWTATAIEDSGFEIRDVHHHLFGTGFPKSLTSKSAAIPEGTGTALKPAVEHWILARKPLSGTVAATVAEYGTGVLQIDACRIDGRERTDYGLANSTRSQGAAYGTPSASADFDSSLGRWPAHLSLDEVGAAALDEQSGIQRDGVAGKNARGFQTQYVGGESRGGWGAEATGYGEIGGASRFFFVAKGSRAEKDEGLERMPKRGGGEATGRKEGSAGTKNARAGAGRTGGIRNTHPTVKSIELMRWLVRLVTPPGGLVLDAFAGSGTTGLACVAEGLRFVGFELKDEYAEIACTRLEAATRQTTLFAAVKPAAKPEPRREQPGLFDVRPTGES